MKTFLQTINEATNTPGFINVVTVISDNSTPSFRIDGPIYLSPEDARKAIANIKKGPKDIVRTIQINL